MVTKICNDCGKDKPLTEFYKRALVKDGRTSYCIDCIRIRGQESYKNNWANNRARIDSNHYKTIEALRERCNEIKHLAGCRFCKEREPICLDFHHRNKAEKEFGISQMIGSHRNWERIQREINKCEIVCANCHRKVHSGLLKL